MCVEVVVVAAWIAASLSLSECEPLSGASPFRVAKDVRLNSGQHVDSLMQGDSTLVISALSRPLHLGTLYNARNDQLIPGVSLWEAEEVKSKTRVSAQSTSRFQVTTSESLSEKMSLLEMDSGVKLGFFSRLVKGGGSAEYLNNTTSSTRQCRVTLKYRATTVFKELVTSELTAPNAEAFDTKDATHVVVGVIYGADALMEFQQTASDASSKQEIQNNLDVMIRKIPSAGLIEEGNVKLDEEEREKVKNVSCTFYGDFHLKEPPSTYEEAAKVYKELPSLLGEKGEKAVPVRVWLYPLSKLSNTESKLKRVISDLQASLIEKVMDDFHQAEIRTNDLLERSKEIKAEELLTKLEQFQSSLQDFASQFLQNMTVLIPAIRGGYTEETALTDFLKSQDASGFNGKEMKQWLDEKETEINVVTTNIKLLPDYMIKSPEPELRSYLRDPDVTDALVFSFTSLSYGEPYLRKISQAAKNFKSGSTVSSLEQDTAEDSAWYRRPEVKEAMQFSLGVFNDLPHKNKVLTFISDRSYPGASVRWYRNGVLRNPHVTNALHLYACDLTLDPNTVHRELLLSEGNRKISRMGQRQAYPDHPDRFDWWVQVLSREPLTGRCYWECEWTGNGAGVGVAYGSIRRKGSWVEVSLGRSNKSWLLDMDTRHEPHRDRFIGRHNHKETERLAPPAGVRRVGVFLDRSAGTLSFYKVFASNLTHLHTYNTTFTNETLYAGFWAWTDSSLSLV